MFQRLRHPAFALLIALIPLLALTAASAAAQGDDGIPLTPGENKIGELAAPGAVQTYTLSVLTPQVIDIQVLALSPGLAPSVRIVAPTGIVLQTSANTGLDTTVRLRSVPVGQGLYRIEVQSASGQVGQFVVGVQTGDPQTPPVPLILGEVLEGEARSQAAPLRYSFVGSETDVLLLYVSSDTPEGGPTVILHDAETLELLGVTSARLAGVRYRISLGAAEYQVEVAHSGAPAGDESYSVCLEVEGGTGPFCEFGAALPPTPTPTLPSFVPTPTPVPPPPPLPSTGACVVASLTGGAVNVRSGPSTGFPVLYQLSGNALAAVTGRLPDGTWFQVNVNGVLGWISTSVIRIGGLCGAVPNIVPTATHTPAVSPTATWTETPTWTPTVTPTWTETPTPTDTPAAAPTLNFSLAPVYGSSALTSGFVPDPFSVGVTAGGPANTSYLGGGCSGFASSAPSFSVNYTGGAFPTLRFYFIGGGDTTMVINTPGGSYVCVDDSFGTLNPTIDFNTPSSGRYDVWVANFAEGASTGGTLYVTENTGNHP